MAAMNRVVVKERIGKIDNLLHKSQTVKEGRQKQAINKTIMNKNIDG